MSRDRFPRGKTAIVGAATYGMGEAPGLSSMDLAVQASVRALGQVGLTPGDVDGLFIGAARRLPLRADVRRVPGHPAAGHGQQPHRRLGLPHARDVGGAGDRGGPVRRGADRLRQQPAHRGRWPGQRAAAVGLRGAVQAGTPGRRLCAGRVALHAPVRPQARAARRGGDRGPRLGAAQPRRLHARPADDGGVPELPHGRRTRSACATAAWSPTAPPRS